MLYKDRTIKYLKTLSIKRVITLLLILFVSLLVLELSLRTFIHPGKKTMFISHPVLFWKVSPDLQGYQYGEGDLACRVDTNGDGFRNHGLSVARGDRSFRILCLGDESTFGSGITQTDTYPALLKNLMRKRFHFYLTEAINGGVEGYSSYQALNLLREYGLKYRPEVITVMVLPHDPKSADRSDRERNPANSMLLDLKRRIYNLHSFKIPHDYLAGSMKRLFPRKPISGGKMRVSPEEFRQNLVEIARLAHSIGTEVIFINPPRSNNRPNYREYREIIRDVAGREGYLVDLEAMFVKNHDYFSPDSSLPGRVGHKAIADEIFRVINTNSLVPQKPGENKQNSPSVKREGEGISPAGGEFLRR